MFNRAYVEITNVCNLACSFCPGTRRPAGYMRPEDFRLLAEKLRGHTAYLYLHVMGEPLLHPQLEEILAIARQLGFREKIKHWGSCGVTGCQAGIPLWFGLPLRAKAINA